MNLKQVLVGLPDAPDLVAYLLDHGPESLGGLDVLGESVADVAVYLRHAHAEGFCIDDEIGPLGTGSAGHAVDERKDGPNGPARGTRRLRTG